MKKIAITGGSGYFGAWVVKEFKENDYEVLNIDMKYPKEKLCRTLIANLTNQGEAYGALKEANADAIVNLAAIPAAYIFTDEVTIRTNIMSTYNILEASACLGIKKAATASSDSTYGIVFSRKPVSPIYVPVDENYPQTPEDPYGFSKLVNEETAKMINRKTGMQIVCLRFVHIAMPDHYKNYPQFNREISSSTTAGRAKEIWNYIDARDAARACRLSVETDGLGVCALNIAADDTCMDIETEKLLSTYYPDVKNFKSDISGYVSLTSNKKAKELLGWKPLYSWRNGA